MIFTFILIGFLVFVELGYLVEGAININNDTSKNEFNPHTDCPICSNRTPTLKKGKHYCENCGFEFKVNKKGHSEIYTKKDAVVFISWLIWFDIVLIPATSLMNIDFFQSYQNKETIDLIKDFALNVVFTVLAYITMRTTILFFIRRKKQLKQVEEYEKNLGIY